MPPVSTSPTSNGLEINKPPGKTILRDLNITFPLVAHAFSATSLTPVEIFGFSILQDSVFSRSVTFLPRNKLFPSFKNSSLVLKRGNCKTCRVKMSLRQRSWGSSKLTYSSQVCRSSHSPPSCLVSAPRVSVPIQMEGLEAIRYREVIISGSSWN